MLIVPNISDYRPFYIQLKTGFAINILDTYKVVVKAREYPSSLKVKEPYKNNWKDRNGDEEYIAEDGLKFEAFNLKLDCAMFASAASTDTAIADIQAGMRAFQNALARGFMFTYDAYTGFGFRDVRLQEFPTPPEDAYDVWNGNTRLLFPVTLKVNDPKTQMRYNPSLNLIVEG